MTDNNVHWLFGPAAEVLPEPEPTSESDPDPDLITDLLIAREACFELREQTDRFGAALLDMLGAHIALALNHLGFGVGEEDDE